jgi:hypothetical protein
MKRITEIDNISVYLSQEDLCTIEIERYEDSEDGEVFSNLTKQQVFYLAYTLLDIYKDMEV